jgi:hypothetical protein
MDHWQSELDPFIRIAPLMHDSPWCPIYSRRVETLSTSGFPYNLRSDFTQSGPTSQLCLASGVLSNTRSHCCSQERGSLALWFVFCPL